MPVDHMAGFARALARVGALVVFVPWPGAGQSQRTKAAGAQAVALRPEPVWPWPVVTGESGGRRLARLIESMAFTAARLGNPGRYAR